MGELRRAAVAACEAGSEVLRRWFRSRSLEVGTKGENDFVTAADRESEAAVIGVLRERFPNHQILGEETLAAAGGDPREVQWIIDPLDGTTNFIQGLPIFAVSVGCRLGGQWLAAATYDPIGENWWTASRGAGAEWNGAPMRVSSRPGLDGAFLATGYPFRARAALDAYLACFRAVFLEARAVRRCGSAAIDLAHTAAGVYDGFFEFRLSPWDIAAGALLIEEAGGRPGRPRRRLVVSRQGQRARRRARSGRRAHPGDRSTCERGVARSTGTRGRGGPRSARVPLSAPRDDGRRAGAQRCEGSPPAERRASNPAQDVRHPGWNVRLDRRRIRWLQATRGFGCDLRARRGRGGSARDSCPLESARRRRTRGATGAVERSPAQRPADRSGHQAPGRRSGAPAGRCGGGVSPRGSAWQCDGARPPKDRDRGRPCSRPWCGRPARSPTTSGGGWARSRSDSREPRSTSGSTRTRLVGCRRRVPLRGSMWVLTARFGPRVDPFTRNRSFHAGIDMAAAVGETVRSPADGVVTFSGFVPDREGPDWRRLGDAGRGATR